MASNNDRIKLPTPVRPASWERKFGQKLSEPQPQPAPKDAKQEERHKPPPPAHTGEE